MRVYNLSQGEVTYKGKKIPPNGGSAEYPDLTFIPNRDLALQDAKVLAFGSLPKWWKTSQALSATVVKPDVPNKNGDVFQAEKKIVITTSDDVAVSDKVSVSMSSERKKK